MQTKIIGSLFWLCVGFYLTPTIPVLGFTVHWALVGLGIAILIPGIKKLLKLIKSLLKRLLKRFLKKIIKELKAEWNKA